MGHRLNGAAVAMARGFKGAAPLRLALAMGVLALATWMYGLMGGAMLATAGLLLAAMISDAGAPPEAQLNGRQRFQEELERARRFGHALTLVRIPAAGAGAASVVTHPSSRAGLTRRIDLAWMEGEDLYLSLYDTREDGAGMVLERLGRHGISPDAACVAVFPDGALTAGALRRLVTRVDRPEPVASQIEPFRAPSAAPLTEYAP